jgi:hypothetical protein
MRKNQRITTSSAWNETKIFPTLRTLLSWTSRPLLWLGFIILSSSLSQL